MKPLKIEQLELEPLKLEPLTIELEPVTVELEPLAKWETDIEWVIEPIEWKTPEWELD